MKTNQKAHKGAVHITCEISCFAFFYGFKETTRLVSLTFCSPRFTKYKNLLFICSDSVSVLAYWYPSFYCNYIAIILQYMLFLWSLCLTTGVSALGW